MNIYRMAETSTETGSARGCDFCALGPCVVCHGLPPAAATELGHWSRAAVVEAGAEIPAGEPGEMQVLASGIARAELRLDAERRQITRFRYAGDALQPAQVNGGGGPARIVAVTSCVLRRIPGEAFEDVGLRHPKVRERRLAVAVVEADHLARHLAAVGRLTAAERLAMFLYDVARRTGRPTPVGGVAFRLPMTREDIADHLGLNVETVSRNLTRLKNAGLIQLPKPSIGVVPSMQALGAEMPFPPP